MTSNMQTAAAIMAKKRHEKSPLNVIVKPLAEKLYFQTKSEKYKDYENLALELVDKGAIPDRGKYQKVQNAKVNYLDNRTFKKWLIEWQEKENRSK